MSVFRRMATIAFVLSGLLLGGAVPLHADHHRCRQRIHEAEWKLRKSIRRHGENSAQAEYRRHRLEELREVCHVRHERAEQREERREERHEEHVEHEEHEHGY